MQASNHGVNLIKLVINIKKFPCGLDRICPRHFEFASDYHYIMALLLQIIFTVVVVPDCLYLGVVTPILKKGKLLTVSSLFPKMFELLVIERCQKRVVPVNVCYASFSVWVSTGSRLLLRFKEFMYNTKGC